MTQFLDYDKSDWKLTEEQQKFFGEMEKELGQPITVIYGRGRTQETRGLEGLTFFDYGTASPDPSPVRVDAIARRNGTTIPLTNHYLLKRDSKREHLFDFNGLPLCEIRLGIIWGLIPLNNFGTYDLMKELWADAIRMAMKEEFFREKEEQKRREIQRAFLDAMKKANELELIKEKETIEQQVSQLAQLNSQLVETHAGIMRAEKRVEIAEKLSKGDQDTYETEIESLMRHTKIDKIDYDSGNAVLEIYTTGLYIHSPDESERSYLGRFLLKMHTKRSNTITIHNLDNQRSSKMHPHVESNGSACWGAIGTQVSKLAAGCNIEGLADLVIRYLETYNVQDANASAARLWFTVKDTQKEREDFDNQWMTEEEYKEAKAQKKEKKEKVKPTNKKEAVVERPTITTEELAAQGTR